MTSDALNDGGSCQRRRCCDDLTSKTLGGGIGGGTRYDDVAWEELSGWQCCEDWAHTTTATTAARACSTIALEAVAARTSATWPRMRSSTAAVVLPWTLFVANRVVVVRAQMPQTATIVMKGFEWVSLRVHGIQWRTDSDDLCRDGIPLKTRPRSYPKAESVGHSIAMWHQMVRRS
mmetsp:Transcript_32139/g.106316  ORF Transcript_32139/g.106316 Transcript_32139/m.106316 type:complete len:176 (+) Transcript_32139:286-813(+)